MPDRPHQGREAALPSEPMNGGLGRGSPGEGGAARGRDDVRGRVEPGDEGPRHCGWGWEVERIVFIFLFVCYF